VKWKEVGTLIWVMTTKAILNFILVIRTVSNRRIEIIEITIVQRINIMNRMRIMQMN